MSTNKNHVDPSVSSGSSPGQPDFEVENHGSIILLRPLTESAHLWIDEQIGSHNGYQPYYPTVVIEPRYLGPILEGIKDDGMVCR